MRLAFVLARRMQQGRKGQIDRAAQRECGKHIGGVVHSAYLQRIGRHQPVHEEFGLDLRLATPFFLAFFIGADGQHQPAHAMLFDQAEAIGLCRRIGAKTDDGGILARHFHHAGIVAVQYAHCVRAENALLGFGIGIHVAMPVEMVLADIQHGGRISV